MTYVEQLLAAVIAAPEDPAPRRAYATGVRGADPQRAELIDRQLTLRELRKAGKQPASDLTIAARELVKKHGRTWAGKLADQVDYFMFWGGFIEEIEITATKFLATANDLVKLAPLRHLRFDQVKAHVAAVAQHPMLAQLAILDLNSCGLGDADVAELLKSPHLARLKFLKLSNNPAITIEALRMIARAKLPTLRYVDTLLTGAPLVILSSDDGGSEDIDWTRTRAQLVDELGHLPWLDEKTLPTLDEI